MNEFPNVRDMFACAVIGAVYQGSIDLGQIDQSAIAAEAYEMANAMMTERTRPIADEHALREARDAYESLRAHADKQARTIAAYKANSTRRKGK